MFNRILVAVDDTENRQIVVNQAIAVARLTAAKLLLVHVLSPSERDFPNRSIFLADGGYLDVDLYTTTIQTYDRTWRTYRQQHLARLQALAEAIKAIGLNVDIIEQVGQPGPLICQTAEEWDADLIVLGRRGLTAVKELMMGSVSNYVLHHAPCAVLVLQGNSLAEVGETPADSASDSLTTTR